ncbi:hypothetical protein [Xanthobacter sp. YC-JY1]|uniref:hypothetical protein n=1 Tax=Xanthobacter sp. YC-JY1 TaxID=2419844 RepID=UPI001F3D0E8D|nr:hypothetical protein [Xanthobacter sp. YC-JY1]UJX46813.1 hypothetical protein D7006_20305 [Xanthobacter sp. YC-JY1]
MDHRTGHGRVAGFAPRALRRTLRNAAGATLLLLCGAAPALALMSPQVYATARDGAKSVIVLAVEGVVITPRAFGTCAVTGTVKVVERGTAYAVDQKVTLDVPCARPNALPPLGGTIYQETDKLQAAKFGRAYLDADGKLVLSQYFQLEALP